MTLCTKNKPISKEIALYSSRYIALAQMSTYTNTETACVDTHMGKRTNTKANYTQKCMHTQKHTYAHTERHAPYEHTHSERCIHTTRYMKA